VGSSSGLCVQEAHEQFVLRACRGSPRRNDYSQEQEDVIQIIGSGKLSLFFAPFLRLGFNGSWSIIASIQNEKLIIEHSQELYQKTRTTFPLSHGQLEYAHGMAS
jgi:hypothetical protein